MTIEELDAQDGDDSQLIEWAAELADRVRAGEPVDLAELARRHPDRAGALRRLDSSAARGSISGVLSRDGQALYQISATPGAEGFVQQTIRSSGGAIEVGPRKMLFRIITPTRSGSNTAAVSPDGTRIVAISTDLEEEFRTQVLTDWTTLIKP